MKTNHKIIIGDSRKMDGVSKNSVQLIVTSPPYWQLKDYGNNNQIGFDDSYEDYINNLNLVWNECCRVLENGCRLCINIGDQFARSVYYGRYKVIPIRTEIIKFCETVGFDYMGAVIWQKVTTSNTTGGATIMGSYPYPRNGILKIDYEFILIFKKPGTPGKVGKEIKEKSKMTKDEWNTYFSGHWNFSGEKQDKHLAMFPVELPNRLIKMFSFVGDTILDPFLGSGTTSLSAITLDRNSIGYEINSEFLPIIEEKLGVTRSDYDQNTNINFISDKNPYGDFSREIENLPCRFNDAVLMDKKVDPRSHNFGSKIDKKSNGHIEYYSVKNIVSPNEIVLNNGLNIKLIGIKLIKSKIPQAKQFLRDKTQGQKVFIKANENHSNCYYLYLKNKTFINGHLLRSGLVELDKKNQHNSKFKNYLPQTTYTGGELNWLNGKYGISAPEKSVPVMQLIRKHNPKTKSELVELIDLHHTSVCDCGIKSKGTVDRFGGNLYHAQLDAWNEYKYSMKECIQWEYDLFVSQSLKGNHIEKKAIAILSDRIKDYKFSEADGYLDEELRLDILMINNSKTIGWIQVKPDSFINMRKSVKKRNRISNEGFGKPVFYLYYDGKGNFINLIQLIKRIRENLKNSLHAK